MNRRNFLKACGLSAAVIAAPNLAFANTEKAKELIEEIQPEVNFYTEFDPTKRYGNEMVVSDLSKTSMKRYIAHLEEDMVRTIPPSYRRYVEYIVHRGQGIFGEESNAIGWHYSPEPKTQRIRAV